MQSVSIGGVLSLPLLLCGLLDAQRPTSVTPPAAEFGAIKAEFAKSMAAFQAAKEAARTEADFEAAMRILPEAGSFAARIKSIALAHPADAVAAEAIVWLLDASHGDACCDDLFDVLVAHHIDSDLVVEACRKTSYAATPKAQAFLRTVRERGKRHAARVWAAYVLAKIEQIEAKMVRHFEGNPQDGPPDWLKQTRGESGLKALQALGRDALAKQAEALEAHSEQLLEEVATTAADVEGDRGSLADQASSDLFESRFLVVGKLAPDIEGKDTDGVAFKLSDYRGKVVFLDFWGYW